MKRSYIIFLLFLIACTGTNTESISGNYIKVTVTGDVFNSDWIKVDNYLIKISLPDTMNARPYNYDYNQNNLSINPNNPNVGHISPTRTYMASPTKAVPVTLTKGQVLLNFGKILEKLSKNNGNSRYVFLSDKITALNGILIFSKKDTTTITLEEPSNLNMKFEPYIKN